MPRIPYRYPEAGADAVADRIRVRRGARGLTPLDGTLLNAPLVADGWNSFIGTLRTKNSLPDDVRELMILRVAACNSAGFEWIHHEHVARAAGVTQEQLAYIGDIPSGSSSGLSSFEIDTSSPTPLSPLQQAAFLFADASTRHVKVPKPVFESFKEELGKKLKESGKDVTVEQQLLEAMAVVGGYNLVSRLLVGLDVDDRADMITPVPVVAKVEVEGGATIHAINIKNFEDPEAPTLLFINSLLTNYTMWEPVLPFFAKKCNIIVYDQRGHGQSSIPASPCTINGLADDGVAILDHFGVKKVKAVVGVSQGGATALSFGIRHGDRTEKVVACDTQAKSPEANKKAWDDRIVLAKAEGMEKLASVTVPRWFSEASSFDGEGVVGKKIYEGVVKTDVEGFAKGAAALQSYDLLADGLVESYQKEFSGGKDLLLIAGECDGALPAGLKALAEKVGSRFESIAKGGHLPMVNEPEAFAKAVNQFLES